MRSDSGLTVETQRRLAGRLFDVVVMDPPWQLATDNPVRGVGA